MKTHDYKNQTYDSYNKIAVDVALIPPKDIIEMAINVNQEMIKGISNPKIA